MTRRSVKVTAGQRRELVWHRDHDQRMAVRERCAAILKIADDESAYAVARGGLLRRRKPDTVYFWIDLFERDGVKGLLSRLHGGNRRPPFTEHEEYLERLRQGPGEEAREAEGMRGPAPTRWTLKRIRAAFPKLHDYTLGGVWAFLRRTLKVKLRSGKVQQYSPDPQYRRKVRRLKRVLRTAAKDPQRTRVVFLDETGFSRWPDAAPDWAPSPPFERPLADRGGANNGLWRIVGALDAITGRVTYLDNYIVGRRALIQFYQRLADAYPRAERIFVVQDNWSIHCHPDVLAALEELPKISPVWLPTYAPWLNPIEKLWKSLKQNLLKMHRLAADWQGLLAQVKEFLDQFARGSARLAHYVGLRGDGVLARCLQTS